MRTCVRACGWGGPTHTHTHTRMHARIYSRSLQGELHHDTNTLAEKGLSECHCVQSGYRHRWKSTMSKPLCVFMKYSGLGPLTLPAVDLPLWRQTAAPRKKWLIHRKICPSSLTKTTTTLNCLALSVRVAVSELSNLLLMQYIITDLRREKNPANARAVSFRFD